MQNVQQLLESALVNKVKFEQNDDEFSFVLTEDEYFSLVYG